MTQESNLSRRRTSARDESSVKYVATRRRVLEAAAAVFRERGYGNTNLQDIADALGMNRATLYYYAESKEYIFREVILQAVRENVRAVQKIASLSAPAPEKVRMVVTGLMTSYEANYPHLYVYIQEELDRVLTRREQSTPSDGEGANREILDHNRVYLVALESIMTEGIRSGDFMNEDPRLMALAVQGMVNWTHRWFKPGGRYDAVRIGAAFADIALSGLMGSTNRKTAG